MGAVLLVALLALAVGPAATTAGPAAGPATGEAAPRITSVEPVRSGDLLACRLRTSGLPGRRARLSMESGLVSSLELLLDVLDGDRRVIAERRLTFRLAFDLWQEVFAVDGPGGERRFADLASLIAYLDHPPPLPLVPLSELPAGGPLRLRVGLLVRPVAPAERERVEQVIGGEERGTTGGAGAREPERDGREVTIDLGRVIRFFYRGGGERPQPQAEAESGPFRPEELSDAD